MPPPPAPEPPLAGARVLITRAADDAEPLRRRLVDLGASVLQLPTIEITPPEDSEPLDRALRDLASFDWVVFSSRRAVLAVLDRLAALDLPVALPGRVAAVGPGTAAELAAHGIAVDCQAPEATGAGLAAALLEQGIAGQRLLLPAGDLARPELAERLEAAGVEVHAVVAYRTVQPVAVRGESLQALRRGLVDVVALASPSAARNLATMLGTDAPVLQYVRLVCIGPTTAAALRELGLEPAAVASDRSVDGLAAAIVAAWNGDEND